jgi:hypothetical protein
MQEVETMLRVAVTSLAGLWLALLAALAPALAQSKQADMLTQTVQSVTNPLSAWQASFSPNMVSRLRPLEATGLSPNCRAVVVGLDSKPVSTAGATLVAGALCINTSRDGLKSGLTSVGVSDGLDASPLKGAVAGGGDGPGQ